MRALPARAIPYWRRAGELAAGRSANLEAIAHLSKGLELIQTLPDAPEHLDEELAPPDGDRWPADRNQGLCGSGG